MNFGGGNTKVANSVHNRSSMAAAVRWNAIGIIAKRNAARWRIVSARADGNTTGETANDQSSELRDGEAETEFVRVLVSVWWSQSD